MTSFQRLSGAPSSGSWSVFVCMISAHVSIELSENPPKKFKSSLPLFFEVHIYTYQHYVHTYQHYKCCTSGCYLTQHKTGVMFAQKFWIEQIIRHWCRFCHELYRKCKHFFSGNASNVDFLAGISVYPYYRSVFDSISSTAPQILYSIFIGERGVVPGWSDGGCQPFIDSLQACYHFPTWHFSRTSHQRWNYRFCAHFEKRNPKSLTDADSNMYKTGLIYFKTNVLYCENKQLDAQSTRLRYM